MGLYEVVSILDARLFSKMALEAGVDRVINVQISQDDKDECDDLKKNFLLIEDLEVRTNLRRRSFLSF